MFWSRAPRIEKIRLMALDQARMANGAEDWETSMVVKEARVYERYLLTGEGPSLKDAPNGEG